MLGKESVFSLKSYYNGTTGTWSTLLQHESYCVIINPRCETAIAVKPTGLTDNAPASLSIYLLRKIEDFSFAAYRPDRKDDSLCNKCSKAYHKMPENFPTAAGRSPVDHMHIELDKL